MDPGTGNIYTPDQAAKLGIPFDSLIPLSDDEAKAFLKSRTETAARLKRRKTNKAARQARRHNR